MSTHVQTLSAQRRYFGPSKAERGSVGKLHRSAKCAESVTANTRTNRRLCKLACMCRASRTEPPPPVASPPTRPVMKAPPSKPSRPAPPATSMALEVVDNSHDASMISDNTGCGFPEIEGSLGQQGGESAVSKEINSEILSCRSLDKCVTLVECRLEEFSSRNTATALMQISRLSELNGMQRFWKGTTLADRAMPLLLEHIRSSIVDYDGRSLSIAILALSKLKVDDKKIYGLAAKQLVLSCSELSPKGLANVAYAYSLANYRDEALFSTIAEETCIRVREFSPQALAIVCYAFALIRMPVEEMFAAVGRRCIPAVEEFTTQEMANILWAFAHTGQKIPALMECFAEEILYRVTEFQLPELVSISYAYARLDYTIPDLMDTISHHIFGNLRSLMPRDISTLAWAFARLGTKSDQMFEAIGKQILLQDPASIDASSWAALLWSFATVNYNNTAIFTVGGEQIAQDASALATRDLSNTAWACARAGHYLPELLDAVAGEASQKAAYFQPVEIRDLVQALSKLQHPAPETLDALAATAAPDLGNYNDRLITDTLTSYSNLGHYHVELFSAAEQQLLGRMSKIAPVGLIHANWAFASPDTPHLSTEFFHALDEELLNNRKRVKLVDLAKVLLRRALVGLPSTELCDRVAEMVPKSKLDQTSLSSVAYSFAALGYNAPEVYDAMEPYAIKMAPKLRPQALTSIAVGYARAGLGSAKLFGAIQSQAAASLSRFRFDQLADLFRAFILAEKPCGGLVFTLSSDMRQQPEAYSEEGLEVLLSAAQTPEAPPCMGPLVEELKNMIASRESDVAGE